jgi:N-acetyltransferase
MFLRHLTPMLGSSQMQQTLEFYTSVLGFTLQEKWEDQGVLRWFSLNKDQVWLMFSLREEEETIAMSGCLYLYPSDVEVLWERVKDKVEVIQPVCETDYGMLEFAILDNNGYELRFGKEQKASTDFARWFPANLTLETDRVRLRVLREPDIEPLRRLIKSDTTWKYFTKDLADETTYDTWMREALSEYASEKRVPFSIFDKERNAFAGSTSYGNISFFDKRIEIGWSWLGDAFKGTGVNTHAKFLLLQYAFETLRFERVEIKTDNLNERSKAALKKIGATPEGVLRSHMQMHSNRRRDSIYFAILKDEWERVKSESFANVK